jgi:hypothetical protein
MQSEGRLLQEVSLDNGLTIYFYDLSRPVVGERSQVRLLVSIPVSVEEEYFRNFAEPNVSYAEFTAALGKTIPFTLEKVRNFIADDNVSEVLEQMKQDFLDSNLTYVSNSKFSERFITKMYVEWKEKDGYTKRHLAAVHNADRNG